MYIKSGQSNVSGLGVKFMSTHFCMLQWQYCTKKILQMRLKIRILKLWPKWHCYQNWHKP